jgi:hypothetical protein
VKVEVGVGVLWVRVLVTAWLGTQMGVLLGKYLEQLLDTELETLSVVWRVMLWAHRWEIQWVPPKEAQLVNPWVMQWGLLKGL